MKIKFAPAFPSVSIFLTIAAAWLLAAHPAAGQAVAMPADHLDSSTGQPAPAEQWLSSDWAGPTNRMSPVKFDSVAIFDVAQALRINFKDSFDIIIPAIWRNPNNPDVSFNPNSVIVNLQLNNVTAFELFNAMNLEFETENTPVRWELKNDLAQHPLAILHVIPALVPGVWGAGKAQPAEKKSMVYFVGDLLDNPPSNGQGPFGGGSTQAMVDLFHTIAETYDLAYHSHELKNELQYHGGAQLLVVTATPDRIAFVQSTLAALRDKKRLETILRAQATPKKPDGASETNK